MSPAAQPKGNAKLVVGILDWSKFAQSSVVSACLCCEKDGLEFKIKHAFLTSLP